MKLESRIIRKLFLNFNDFQPQNFYNHYSYAKLVAIHQHIDFQESTATPTSSVFRFNNAPEASFIRPLNIWIRVK